MRLISKRYVCLCSITQHVINLFYYFCRNLIVDYFLVLSNDGDKLVSKVLTVFTLRNYANFICKQIIIDHESTTIVKTFFMWNNRNTLETCLYSKCDFKILTTKYSNLKKNKAACILFRCIQKYNIYECNAKRIKIARLFVIVTKIKI